MKISNEQLEKLANIIIQKIDEEFEDKHLSGNLVKTLQIEVEDGKVRVVIPAKTYNMVKFFKEGVIVHTSNGSYASKLDVIGSEFYIYPKGVRKGGFRVRPHNHIGYVEKVIKEAINDWLAQLQEYKGKVVYL